MGYYTDYNLSAYGKDGKEPDTSRIEALEAEIEKMKVFDGGSCYDESWWANAKWYDWESDMVMLSRRFPDFTFYLEGHGEDRDDIWGAYFQGGLVMPDVIEIVQHPFNPKKLIQSKCAKCKNTYSYQGG